MKTAVRTGTVWCVLHASGSAVLTAEPDACKSFRTVAIGTAVFLNLVIPLCFVAYLFNLGFNQHTTYNINYASIQHVSTLRSLSRNMLH